MRRFLAAILFVFLVGGLFAQATVAMVAMRLSGTQKTQLLHVDLITGRTTALGRFSQDALTLLALGIDLLNGDGVLALDLGGKSRVLRFAVASSLLASSSVDLKYIYYLQTLPRTDLLASQVFLIFPKNFTDEISYQYGFVF